MGWVLFARHAQTTWGSEGRLQGRAPTRLTDRGREQAAASDRVLEAADGLVVEPGTAETVVVRTVRNKDVTPTASLTVVAADETDHL